MSKRFQRFLNTHSNGGPAQPVAPVLPDISAPAQEPDADFTQLMKLLNPEPEEPSMFEKYAPAGVRGLSGLFGVTPLTGAAAGGVGEVAAQALEGRFSPSEIAAATAVGAAGGGLARTVMGAKTALQAAGRAVPWAAAQPIVHSVISEGELPEASDVLINTAVGAGTAGAAGKLMEMLGVGGYGKPKVKIEEPAFHVESNAPVGGTIRRTENGKIIPDAPPAPIKSPTANQPVRVPAPVAAATDDADLLVQGLQDYQAAAGHADNPLMQDPYATASGRVERAMEKQARAQQAEQRAAALAEKEAAALRKEEDAAAEIAAARESGDFDTQETLTESFEASVPGGKERLTRRYVPKADEDDIEGGVSGMTRPRPRTPAPAAPVAPTSPIADLLGATPAPIENSVDDALKALLNGTDEIVPVIDDVPVVPTKNTFLPYDGPNQPVVSPEVAQAESRRLAQEAITGPGPVVKPIEHVTQDPNDPAFLATEAWRTAPDVNAPPAPTSGADPLSFFKSRTDAAGSHYRALQGLGKGAVPTDPLTGKNPVRLAGKELQREASSEGLPVRQSPVKRDLNVATTQKYPPLDLKAALAKIDAAKGRPGGPGSVGPGGFGSLSSFLRGESGAADPAVMAKLGMGGVGAAIGAATSDEDDQITGALLGGAAGVGAASAIPKIVQGLGRLAQAAANDPGLPIDAAGLLERFKTPEGTVHTIKESMKLLPAYVRANLLTSPNLLNNAFVAPWGSGMMNGIEMHLAGDPQGIELIRGMRPDMWAQRWVKSWEEAKMLIDDAETAALERAGGFVDPSTPLGRMLGAPGTMITAGDVTTRNIGKEVAGMTEDQVRRMTMTSEPEWRVSKAFVDAQRSGSTAAQLMLPFAKTMFNYVEQGAMRSPVAGIAFQMARNNPDPLTRIMVQQMLGTGAVGAGLAAGMNDPTTDPRATKLFRSAITAGAGPYGLLTGIGYAAGKAIDGGDDNVTALNKGITAGAQQLPIPSLDIFNEGKDLMLPKDGAERQVPRALMPLSGLYSAINPPETTGRRGRKPKKPRERD